TRDGWLRCFRAAQRTRLESPRGLSRNRNAAWPDAEAANAYIQPQGCWLISETSPRICTSLVNLCNRPETKACTGVMLVRAAITFLLISYLRDTGYNALPLTSRESA